MRTTVRTIVRTAVEVSLLVFADIHVQAKGILRGARKSQGQFFECGGFDLIQPRGVAQVE